MYRAIMLYLIDMLILDANVLRDSILVPLNPSYRNRKHFLTLTLHHTKPKVRMEMTPFECYVHVNAIMWRVVYRELRALTNDATMNLNPMELNNVYEDLWNVGTLLQTDAALSVLQDDYRPWPKVKEETKESRNFYKVHDRDKQAAPPYLSPPTDVPHHLHIRLS